MYIQIHFVYTNYIGHFHFVYTNSLLYIQIFQNVLCRFFENMGHFGQKRPFCIYKCIFVYTNFQNVLYSIFGNIGHFDPKTVNLYIQNAQKCPICIYKCPFFAVFCIYKFKMSYVDFWHFWDILSKNCNFVYTNSCFYADFFVCLIVIVVIIVAKIVHRIPMFIKFNRLFVVVNGV